MDWDKSFGLLGQDKVLPNTVFRRDKLAFLHASQPLPDKLQELHRYARERLPDLDRVAVVTYDPRTDLLKTFLHASGGADPLSFYASPLAQSQSLSSIAQGGHPRLVNDIAAANWRSREHSRRISGQGYGTSYTLPMIYNGELFGFIFFNSRQTFAFKEKELDFLDEVGHQLSLVVINELVCLRTLGAGVRTMAQIAQHRDFETGLHLERMAHYSHLIARLLGAAQGLDDSFVEYVFLFAPLHDLGKVAVPDALLQKPGKLTREEFRVIQEHPVHGAEMVDAMLANFGLSGLPQAAMLRHIVRHHHEALDGSGYPDQLAGTEIPLEARIVAVADVFDALTSRRPYKEAWSNEAALAVMTGEMGAKLDQACVAVLVDNPDLVTAIQNRFQEDSLG